MFQKDTRAILLGKNGFSAAAIRVFFLISTIFFLSQCGTKKNTTDTSAPDDYSKAVEAESASAMALSSVAQALNGSAGTGTLSAASFALVPLETSTSVLCPTIASPTTDRCTVVDATSLRLNLNACVYGAAATATWTGDLLLNTDGTSLVCEATNPFEGATAFVRQFVDATNNNSPSSGTRVSAAGTSITIDHSTANLTNFDGQTIAAIAPLASPTGYGQKIQWDSAAGTKTLIIRERFFTSIWDHTVDGTLVATEGVASRTISTGTIKTYHNKLKIIGTVTLTNILFKDGKSCPCGGIAETSYSAGATVTTPTIYGNSFVGKKDKLEIKDCGLGVYTDVIGNEVKVKLGQCL